MCDNKVIITFYVSGYALILYIFSIANGNTNPFVRPMTNAYYVQINAKINKPIY